jgi:hypothetical protein
MLIHIQEVSLRRFSRPLASRVLPWSGSGAGAMNQKARNSLELRANLVAGVGFEPTTFRL